MRRERHPWRINAFCAMSTAASRRSEARRAAAGTSPGSPARVRAADLYTSLVDWRCAHTLSFTDVTVDDVSPQGILTMDATLRRRAAERAAESAP